MDDKMKISSAEELFRAILTLQTPEECADFFGDLCTVQELRAMSQRYQVAVMLKEKKVYSDIVKATGYPQLFPQKSPAAPSVRQHCGGFRIAVKQYGQTAYAGRFLCRSRTRDGRGDSISPCLSAPLPPVPQAPRARSCAPP